MKRYIGRRDPLDTRKSDRVMNVRAEVPPGK